MVPLPRWVSIGDLEAWMAASPGDFCDDPIVSLITFGLARLKQHPHAKGAEDVEAKPPLHVEAAHPGVAAPFLIPAAGKPAPHAMPPPHVEGAEDVETAKDAKPPLHVEVAPDATSPLDLKTATDVKAPLGAEAVPVGKAAA